MPQNNFLQPMDVISECSLHETGGLRTQGDSRTFIQEYPSISIIVAVFNGASFIEETILSVLNQDYCNIELIVIDGCSTDGTQEILKQYENEIDFWLSEPDTGISNAFNKGVKLARGDYINFQGAGDYLINDDVVSKMLCGVNSDLDMLVCGRIERVAATSDKRVLGVFPQKYFSTFKKTSLLFRMSLPHQALLTNKKMFDKYGLFDESNLFCMDYEHLLRAYHEFPNVVLKDVNFSAWREGGVGTGRIREVLREYNYIKYKNRVAPSSILWLVNLFIILKFYLRNYLNALTKFSKN